MLRSNLQDPSKESVFTQEGGVNGGFCPPFAILPFMEEELLDVLTDDIDLDIDLVTWAQALEGCFPESVRDDRHLKTSSTTTVDGKVDAFNGN